VRDDNAKPTEELGWEVRVTCRGSLGLRAEAYRRDDLGMALRLARPEDITVRVAHGRRWLRAPMHTLPGHAAIDAVGRGLAIGLGLGLLLNASPGAISVTVVGILALGSALLSWDR
jgi:hypothetical protein